MNEKTGKGGKACGDPETMPLRLFSGLPMQVCLCNLLWPGHVPFLFLSRGVHFVSLRCDFGGPGDFVTTPWKREAIGMKVVVVEKRKGFLAMVLRRMYGIKKLEEG